MAKRNQPGLIDVPGKDFTPNRRDAQQFKDRDIPVSGIRQVMNFGTADEQASPRKVGTSAFRTTSATSSTKPTAQPGAIIQPGFNPAVEDVED